MNHARCSRSGTRRNISKIYTHFRFQISFVESTWTSLDRSLYSRTVGTSSSLAKLSQDERSACNEECPRSKCCQVYNGGDRQSTRHSPDDNVRPRNPFHGPDDQGPHCQVGGTHNVHVRLQSLSNGLVKRGHGPLVNMLAKLIHTQPSEWFEWLPLALFVDRTTTKPTTGYTPFELIYGRRGIYPFEL